MKTFLIALILSVFSPHIHAQHIEGGPSQRDEELHEKLEKTLRENQKKIDALKKRVQTLEKNRNKLISYIEIKIDPAIDGHVFDIRSLRDKLDPLAAERYELLSQLANEGEEIVYATDLRDYLLRATTPNDNRLRESQQLIRLRKQNKAELLDQVEDNKKIENSIRADISADSQAIDELKEKRIIVRREIEHLDNQIAQHNATIEDLMPKKSGSILSFVKKALTAPVRVPVRAAKIHQQIEDKMIEATLEAAGAKSASKFYKKKSDIIRPERPVEKVAIATGDEIARRMESDIEHVLNGDIREGYRYFTQPYKPKAPIAVGMTTGVVGEVVSHLSPAVLPILFGSMKRPDLKPASSIYTGNCWKDENTLADGLLIFVNGINNTEEESLRSARALAAQLRRQVCLLYNPTTGVAADSLEGLLDIIHHPNLDITVRQLLWLFYHHSGDKISVVAHSEGGIQFRNAYSFATFMGKGEKLRRSLAVVTAGTPLEDEDYYAKPIMLTQLRHGKDPVINKLSAVTPDGLLLHDGIQMRYHSFRETYVRMLEPDMLWPI